MLSELFFTPGQLDQIILHIESCLPEEACGMVGGLEGTARRVIPIENELHSPVRFRMAALAQLHGFDQIEEQGWDLMAIFHSHPQGPPNPSPTDIAEFYYPGTTVIIASPLNLDQAANGPAGGLVWGNWRVNGFVIDQPRVLTVKLNVAA
jgi:proteasome lid subunit RPN8/RPN11